MQWKTKLEGRRHSLLMMMIYEKVFANTGFKNTNINWLKGAEPLLFLE